MTESDWLTSESRALVVDGYLGDDERNITSRKARLFACACCRRFWKFLPADSSQLAIEATEKALDGLISPAARRIAVQRAEAEYHCSITRVNSATADLEAQWSRDVVTKAVYFTAVLYEHSGYDIADAVGVARDLAAINPAGAAAEDAMQAALFRHLLGNPFHPYPNLPTWPEPVVQLAQSLYDGSDCAFALHDALLDAGLTEFADHFKQEAWHPKGCWLLDLILGKS